MDRQKNFRQIKSEAVDPWCSERRHVPFVDLPSQFREERTDILNCVERVFSGGHFLGESHLEEFEHAVAEYCGVAYAIGVASGTDALFLAMKAMKIGLGDEVITPPNSHFSSTTSIVHTGATPVFVDVNADQNIDPTAIEAAITPRTKAVMPVHLTGRMADMESILDIAQRHGLLVVEDAAQAFGARLGGKPSGSFGQVAAFSANPLKNLNCAGDAGFVTTENKDIAERVRVLRNNGIVARDNLVEWGYASRLDVLHAEILKMRLPSVARTIELRRANANIYRSLFRSDQVFVPPCQDNEYNTFHTFVIQAKNRDALKTYLDERGVQTAVHYPVPIHLQPVALPMGFGVSSFPVVENLATKILSLPIHPYLSEDDVAFVAEMVNSFYR